MLTLTNRNTKTEAGVLRIFRLGAVFGFAVLLPVVASAQAAISGVVRDSSGALLPGGSDQSEVQTWT